MCNFQVQCPLQEFSRRVCQHVGAFEKEKRNKKRSLRRPTLWLVLLSFFEWSQLLLMFHVIADEAALFVLIVFIVLVTYTFCMYYFFFLRPPFSNLGLRLGSSGFPEGAPSVTVIFLAFYTDIGSYRQQQQHPHDNHQQQHQHQHEQHWFFKKSPDFTEKMDRWEIINVGFLFAVIVYIFMRICRNLGKC